MDERPTRGRTVYGTLAFLFLPGPASPFFDPLQETLSDTDASFSPFVLNSLAFLLVCGFYRSEAMLFLVRKLGEDGRALKR